MEEKKTQAYETSPEESMRTGGPGWQSDCSISKKGIVEGNTEQIKG